MSERRGSASEGIREQRLRDTLQVMALLATADFASVTRTWFMGMNRQLNGAFVDAGYS
ncbi:hypothetical protein SAMN05216219_1811 [Mycetocola miduiensis]|uniref:Uncharacterized protein n=1 Tax=Mycetocola miduiensis TaxID=995034 RepID=A0A1I5B8S3_9MICO|nr:hypothetical protein SAMN05216219_1811 [Mycetocola miduiensis]